MFNHVRTLLLNQDGSANPGLDFPGEEAVPVSFRAVQVPAVVQLCRTILFGRNPDRLMLNYRLREFMTILHSTELDEHVRAFDPRITYDLQDTSLFDDSLFTVRVEGGPGHLQVIGLPQADENQGRLLHQFRVSCGNAGQVTVRQETPPVREEVFNLDEVSDVVLDGKLRCLPTRNPGSVWHVTSVARPVRTLPQIVEALRKTVTEPREVQLFGADPDDPYRTYRNLWKTHEQLPYALGGLLMAVACRTHEAWRKGV